MNIQSAKQQIKDAVEAYLKKDDAGLPVIAPVHQRPMFLLGAPGIGKTAIMEQIAGELGIGIVSYSMTHHTRQSALGLPRIEHHDFEGYEYEASEYTMSEIVSAVYDYMTRTGLRQGILFLDEINCVSETLYPSMLQFLQFKKFGKHKVPEGWVVVCAGNPPEYNRSVHEFDIVTLDRMREIDVDPDYAVWKSYAQEKGLHPAVTTFLDAKKDCFYKVESKPGGGKSFVTARGWEDLATIISLYEEMGKPVDRELFSQFLRDDGIADAFTVYYALFQKYRSDYQVDAILDGEAGEAIVARAKEAEFDERVALISLLLDTLARECNEVLEQEGVVVELRDLFHRAAHGQLARFVRDEDDGDVFDLFALLHEIDDADVVVREDARDFGKYADAVAHGQADIVAAAEVGDELYARLRRLRVPERGILVFAVRRRIDDVRDDGAARGERARAPAVEHDVAHAVALQKYGVEGIADGGERVIFADEGGMHAHFDVVPAVVFADGEKFEHIAHCLAVCDILFGDPRDPLAEHLRERHFRMEGKRREDGNINLISIK